MSQAAVLTTNPPEDKSSAPESAAGRVTELRVSGHLMTLDPGLFCIFARPGAAAAANDTGLPGVRISLPPGSAGRPEAVRISTFREDGWLAGNDGAALIHVASGAAQVLVTIYQSPSAPPDAAPRLQVLRLSGNGHFPTPTTSGRAAMPSIAPTEAEILAHVQRSGDMGAGIGEWAGMRGSRLWIEGFAITPQREIAAEDIEYQAVLGRGWLSPWVEGGKFCGSRGMALPLLGLNVRLKGDAAETHEISVTASFVDGSEAGPVTAGHSCEAESLAALEAFRVSLVPKSASKGPRQNKPASAPPRAAKPEPAPAQRAARKLPARRR